jgi:Restriction endonuclease
MIAARKAPLEQRLLRRNSTALRLQSRALWGGYVRSVTRPLNLSPAALRGSSLLQTPRGCGCGCGGRLTAPVMKPPSFEDFGVETESWLRFQNAPRRARRLAVAASAVVGASVGAGIGFPVAIHDGNAPLTVGLAWSGLGVLAGAFLGSFPAEVASRHATRREQRTAFYRLALAPYERAVKAYGLWKRTTSEYWAGLRGRSFEAELARLYVAQGYSASLTSASNDKGIDIVLRQGAGEFIVQCKGYADPVGPAVARELYGTFMASRATGAILACPGGFTNGVREFVKDKPIVLLGLPEIVRMAESASPQVAGPTRDGQHGGSRTITDIRVLIHNAETDRVDCRYIGELGGLEELTVEAARTTFSDGNLGFIEGRLTSLRKLRLSLAETRITDEGVACLAQLINLQELRLDVGGTRVTNDGLRCLARLTNLRLLELGLCATSVTDDGLRWLSAIAQLEKLELAGSPPDAARGEAARRSPVGGRTLESVSSLSGLRELDMSWSCVSSDGLRHLEALRNLAVLDLSNTEVTSDGLPSLGRLGQLRWLDLFGTRVTFAAIDEWLLPELPNVHVRL